MKKTIILVIVAIIAVVTLIFVGILSVPAKAITLEEYVTQAQSDIKVQEKRRADLWPALAECVKAYDKHEYQTLLDVINARTQNGTISDEGINEIKNAINIIIEKYPALESQKNYSELMKEISVTENKIASTRESYNKSVTRYNVYTRNPINKIFLSITGYEKTEFPKLSYDVSENAPTNLFG